MIDLLKTLFSSTVNYLKRNDMLSGSQTISITGTSPTITIQHNLGYIPFWAASSTITDDTVIWSSKRHPVNIHLTANPPGPTLFSYSTTTTLTIGLLNADSDTGDRTIHYVIYLDYGN